MENNKVLLIGKVTNTPEKVFTSNLGVTYYKSNLEISRVSETVDTIPVMFSEDKLQSFIDAYNEKMLIHVEGYYRSRNEIVNEKRKLVLCVYAEYAEMTDCKENINEIELTGYIVKTPVFRKTPNHRSICDIMVAVNRDVKSKSDYIPCIVWGRNAYLIKDTEVGQKIKLNGRIQSRNYEKTIDGNTETRIAYEVSVNQITKEN